MPYITHREHRDYTEEDYARANTRYACPICYAPVPPRRAQDKEGRCSAHKPRPLPPKRERSQLDPEENYAYV